MKVLSVSSDQAQFWLMKTDAAVYSLADLIAEGTTHWEGVRNYAARNNMRSMRVGDQVLFYHSNCADKGVVGTARVVKEAYPDHYALDPKSKYYDERCDNTRNLWDMVDIRYESSFASLVSLAAIRAEKVLGGMQLVKPGNRLSVFPVTEREYAKICQMGQLVA